MAPDQPNLREVLTHNVNAWLFDPSSAGALEQAIEQLLDRPEDRQRLAHAAAGTIEKHDLTWERNAERVLELASLLSKRGPGAAAARERSAPPMLGR